MNSQTPELTKDETTTLSVLAFLFFRMGMPARARRVYEALAELSPKGTGDYRFAKAGLAAVEIELGNGPQALKHLSGAFTGRPLSSRDATLYLLKAQALWMSGRQEEGQAARDEFLVLSKR